MIAIHPIQNPPSLKVLTSSQLESIAMYPRQPLSPKETLPTMYDLPSEYSEELGLPDEFYDVQAQLLKENSQSPTDLADQVFEV